MKFAALLFAAFVALVIPADAQEKKKFVLYATLLVETPVQLGDGAKWMMEKGDSFPVLMFKEQQTKVVLQLAGTNFTTEANRVKIVQEADVTDEMIANYRKNVQSYIDSTSEKIQKSLKPPKKE